MLKHAALLIALCTFSFMGAQENFIHIPSTATYIITLKPMSPEDRTDAESVSRLEMFGNGNSYNDDLYLFGTNSLEKGPREKLTSFISEAISSPRKTGVDSTRSIYAFHEENDTCSYWAYIFPVANADTFGDHLSASLFGNGALTVKQMGFSSITSGKITAGWTSNYAIVLLADYYYPTEAFSFWEEMELNQQARIEDSIAASEAALEAAYEQSHMLTDSSKKARTAELDAENKRLLEVLSHGDLPADTSLQYHSAGWSNGDVQEEKYEEHDTQAFFILNRLMNLEYDSSIASNKNFSDLQKEDFEASYWYNYGLVMKTAYENKYKDHYQYNWLYGENHQPDLDTMQFPTIWENSYVAGLITFNDTVTEMDHRISVGDDLSELTTGMYHGRVNRKMLNYVKADNLMSLVCLSVDMEKFMKFGGNVYRENILYSGGGYFAQTYLAMWDIIRVFLDEETMYNILNGQFVFAVTDLKPVVSTYVTYEYDEDFNRQEVVQNKTEIIPEFVFMAGVGRKKDMQKIINVLVSTAILTEVKKNCYTLTAAKNPASQLYIVFQKGMLMFTNNEDLVNNHLEKGYTGEHRLSKDMRKMARSSPMVAWWDGRKTFETLRTIQKDDPDAPQNMDLEQNVSSGLIIGKKGKKNEHRIHMTLIMPANKEEEKKSPIDRFFHFLNGLFLITR